MVPKQNEKIMFNFSIISLISLILIYQNILLINEETLILICFTIFCWVIYTKLGDSLNNDLTQRSLKIENSMANSMNQVLESLDTGIKNRNTFKTIPQKFQNLGNHFLKLSFAVSNGLPIYLRKKSESVYSKKFFFIQRVETQTTKLLALLLVQRINKIVAIQKFYTHDLKLKNFLCFYSISLLNYIKSV